MNGEYFSTRDLFLSILSINQYIHESVVLVLISIKRFRIFLFYESFNLTTLILATLIVAFKLRLLNHPLDDLCEFFFEAVVDFKTGLL